MLASVLLTVLTMVLSSLSVRLHSSNWPSMSLLFAIALTVCSTLLGLGSAIALAADSTASQSMMIATSFDLGFGPGYL